MERWWSGSTIFEIEILEMLPIMIGIDQVQADPGIRCTR